MLKSTLAAVAAVFALSAVSPAALAAKGDPHVLLTTSAGILSWSWIARKPLFR